MNTLISVLGSTATGKTSFALKLAEQALELKNPSGEDLYAGVDLISADSRQVYKGLEILSGADIPEGFDRVFSKKKTLGRDSAHEEFSYFEKNTIQSSKSISFYGVSILDLTDEWSVAHFKNFAVEIIKNSFANNRLPIIVGGTNLYINNLFNRDSNLYVKPIEEIRMKASSMSVKELQDWLKSVNPKKLLGMNNSDINNSRRLIRAIEISVGKPEFEKIMNLPDDIKNIKFCLLLNLETISEKINKRVVKRFENNVIYEIKKLNEACAGNSGNSNAALKILTVCTTLGADDINDYLKNEISQEKCLENWALHEFQYAKRQLVWLKKEKDVLWLDDLRKSSYTLSSKLFEK